jgi:hypothetical protein
MTISLFAVWDCVVHFVARTAIFWTHRALRIAPGISLFVPRSDKRTDADIVRDAMLNLTRKRKWK